MATVQGRPAAATARAAVSGVGSGLVAAAWLLLVVMSLPVPASVWLAFAAIAAAATAVLAAGNNRGRVSAGVLAVMVAAMVIFGAVEVLAHWGTDRFIPPSAGRARLIGAYGLLLACSVLTANVLGLVSLVRQGRVTVRLW